MENGAEGGVEMRAVSSSSFSYSFEDDEEFQDGASRVVSSSMDLDGEYGEPPRANLAPPRRTTRTTTATTRWDDEASSSSSSSHHYRASVMRQNRFFGVSMILLAGLFVGAYFLMGLSFTPANVGIFGDESSMRGGSGEVGLDADNAKTQAIVDEEVTEMEESEHWGEMGHVAKAAKGANALDRIKTHDKVGKHDWVEDADWWKEHAPDMDVSKMTNKEANEYYKAKKKEERLRKRCENHPNDVKCKEGGKVATDLIEIREKLANHYETVHGDGQQGAVDPSEEAAYWTSPPDGGAGGIVDVVHDEVVGEVAEDVDNEQHVDDVAMGDQVEGLVQSNRIFDHFIVLEQVAHDASSFV
jgi:hypothetical protein